MTRTKAPHYRNHWNAPFLGLSCHSHWSFLENAGSVGPPFAGDHQVGSLQLLLEPDRITHQVNSRLYPRVSEGYQAGGESSGSPSSWNPPHVYAQLPFHHPAEPVQGLVQLFNDGSRGAFLWAVHRRGPRRTAQGIVNISCGNYFGLHEAQAHP